MDNGKAIAIASAGLLAGIGISKLFGSEQKAKKGCPWSEKTVKSGLKEFSVVYTDRAFNLMSEPFQVAMRDIAAALRKVYNSHSVALIPGSGTYAMESVARQFGTNQKVMVLRNGYFSFRWSDIFDCTKLTTDVEVLCAQPSEAKADRPYFAPYDAESAADKIRASRPAAVFAPHVETATGMILSDDYLRTISAACREVGAVFVLDCIASGNVWVDMKTTGVDVLISAPQKGWTGPACCGLVMLSERADKLIKEGPQPGATSFCCNLKKWLEVMDTYVAGGFKYYTTLPTDALMMFHRVIKETEKVGFDVCRNNMLELGKRVRAVLTKRGFKSVAAPGFQAPGVVVSYSPIEGMAGKFKQQGIQIAGGVPFKIGEEQLGLDTRKMTFRIGLFGLDKIMNIDETVKVFEAAVDKIVAANPKAML